MRILLADDEEELIKRYYFSVFLMDCKALCLFCTK